MPDKPGCELLKGPAYDICMANEEAGPDGATGSGGGGGGMADGAADSVRKMADKLITQLHDLLVPEEVWAPDRPDSVIYEPFQWLGQHLAVVIATVVVVVCALTAWRGAPHLRQMGTSVGSALVAIIAMGAIPGAVDLLAKAVSSAFTAAFNSNESTLFATIGTDMNAAARTLDPLPLLLIVAALVVALALAGLVFLCRQLGILVFVCLAPLVLASLARGGDTSAVRAWAGRLLGLMFAPFALLIVAPFVALAKGNLVMDGVLLVAADVVMLRMIFHGVPYFGPRIAGKVRTVVERHTTNRLVRDVVRAGVPTFYEQENSPRIRTVPTPGRAVAQDGDRLLAAYGIRQPARPGRLTTDSAIAQTHESAERYERMRRARLQSRAAVQAAGGGAPAGTGRTVPQARPASPAPRPAGPPATSPGAGPQPPAGPPPAGPPFRP
ncbi:hypothetical protein C6N75_24375 [Streptomyces solincola]|uniref:Uncharacterized protein n=1 Tax=Streptomyces solincola TaxID=2100817 RepID=A0A2S9PQH8_9ACTN|nr:hypothetical protein [Streptomyces solincola]PRH76664.1 hypothetical protein C6N75_24375 [Streptomyces solincola]